MRARFGLLLATSLTLGLGACAGGGGAGAGGATPSEEGYPPEQNEYTATAQLNLNQAQSAETDSVAQARYEAALAAAEQGMQQDTLNPLSYYQAALSLVMLERDYPRAASLLDQAEELYPAFRENTVGVREQGWINLYNRAIEPLNQGNLEEAARLFEQANEMYSGRPEAYLNLGSIYSQLNQPEDAAEAFESALEVADEQVQRLAAMDSVDQAMMESARQSQNIAVQNLAQTLQSLERYGEAVSVYEEYIQENPDDIQALSLYASILSQANMPDSATAIYESLLARDDLSSVEYGYVGVGLFGAERWEQASQAFRRALELNPMSREPAFNLVQAEFSSEDWQAVLDATENALELDPRTGILYQQRARAFVETGDQQTGSDVLEEYQSLAFELDGLQLQTTGGGGNVTGILTNNSVAQGEPIVLRFHFTNPTGDEIGTDEVTVPAPAEGGNAQVEARYQGEETLGGYWYEVVRP
ncbi:MAG: tetratricopeptide repeat protein [Longimicrobiales bacterium]|nr:tetratricopeptide repeat protein [Longimicrobiales bacterium]